MQNEPQASLPTTPAIPIWVRDYDGAHNMRDIVLVITPLIDMLALTPLLTSEAIVSFCWKRANVFLSFRELLFSFSAFAADNQKHDDRRNYNDNKDFIGTQ